RRQNARDLRDALALVAPVVKGHRAEHEVEGGGGKWQGLGHRLLKPNRAVRVRGLRLPHHLDGRVDAAELRPGEPSLRETKQPTGATSDIEDCAWVGDLLGRELQHRALHGLEDDALHPVPVVLARPAVEALYVMSVCHHPDRTHAAGNELDSAKG